MQCGCRFPRSIRRLSHCREEFSINILRIMIIIMRPDNDFSFVGLKDAFDYRFYILLLLVEQSNVFGCGRLVGRIQDSKYRRRLDNELELSKSGV